LDDNSPRESGSGEFSTAKVTVGVVILLVLVVLVIWALPFGRDQPAPAAPPTGDCQTLAPGMCVPKFDLKGQNGKVPTHAQFVASMAVNDRLVYEWHLDKSLAGEATMPRTDQYTGFLLMSGCTGGGRFSVSVDTGDGDTQTLTVGCNGAIGPGLGFPVMRADAPNIVRPIGPVTFHTDNLGTVTDAEFFVTAHAAASPTDSPSP